MDTNLTPPQPELPPRPRRPHRRPERFTPESKARLIAAARKGGAAARHFTPESKQRQIEGGRRGGKMGRGGAPRGNLNGVRDGAYSERALRALHSGSLTELRAVLEAIHQRRLKRAARLRPPTHAPQELPGVPRRG